MDKNNSIAMQAVGGLLTTVGTLAIKEISDIIKNNYIAVLDINQYNTYYDVANKILYELNPKEYNKFRIPIVNDKFIELTSGISYFLVFKKYNFIKVETYGNYVNKNTAPEQHLKISFIGKNRYKLKQIFFNKVINFKNDNKIKMSGLDDFRAGIFIEPRNFNDIILDINVKNRIISGLSNWESSKDWYREHNLTHKIGILLYGKAGTGKTSVAKAISSMFSNAPIFTFNPRYAEESIRNLSEVRNRTEGTIIVLIEDFDIFFKKRETNSVQDKDYSNSLNIVFQMLDGTYSTEDTIYIATTNYKDRIDDALIRYGRFDIQEELDYFDKEKALEFVKSLDYGEQELDNLEVEYPVQPSLLQSKIMEYRADNLNRKGEK